MSPLEISLSLLTGLAGSTGASAWVRHHQHPDLVSRNELSLLQDKLELILGEIRYLRERLDRRPSDR